jgi:hypothetical protein
MDNIKTEDLMKFFLASSKFMIHVTGMDLSQNGAFIQSIAMLNKLSPAKRLSGLKQAANDTLDMIQDLNNEQAKIFEEILEKEGCHPLAYYKSKNKKVIARLLGKKPIRNESDYYALKNHFESEWQKIEKDKAEVIQKKLLEFENRKPGAVIN